MATKPASGEIEVYDEVAGRPLRPITGYTYRDLLAFPEDNYRREIIGGELIVTAAPGGRHQEVVGRLYARLLAHTEAHGGKVYVAPRDVYLADDTVVEPDIVYVSPENVDRAEEPYVRGAADIVVEVSSPSTRRLELVRKKDLYARSGIAEYWYLDLAADRVEVYRPGQEGVYDPPVLLGAADALGTPLLPGFSVSLAYVLGGPQGAGA